MVGLTASFADARLAAELELSSLILGSQNVLLGIFTFLSFSVMCLETGLLYPP